MVIGIIVGIMVISAGYYRFFHNSNEPSPANSIVQNTTDNTERFDNTSNTASNTSSNSTNTETTTTKEETLGTPTNEFTTRITKKYFGTYVTPENSPVKPERFTGLHTGVDVEFTDTDQDVPVYAVADCKVVLSKIASGYGGVFAVQFDFKGKTYTALYGHIRPATLPAVGTSFKKNQQIAVLGSGFTSETDKERHHLHFSIHSGTSLDIRGYVQKEAELSSWVDPLALYK